MQPGSCQTALLQMALRPCGKFLALAVLSLCWLQNPIASLPSGRTSSARSSTRTTVSRPRPASPARARAGSSSSGTAHHKAPHALHAQHKPRAVQYRGGGRRLTAKAAIGKPKPNSAKCRNKAKATNAPMVGMRSVSPRRTSTGGRLQATAPKPRPTQTLHSQHSNARHVHAPMVGMHHHTSHQNQHHSYWPSYGPLNYWRVWRSQQIVRRAQVDPNFAANVGQAIDTVRGDHAQLPGIAPGASVSDPGISLEIAQVTGLRFVGLLQYRQFWDNFRQGVELISTSARSEVTNVVHSGLYLRVRWRLVMVPRSVLGKEQARSAVQAARGALQNFEDNVPWGKTDLFQAGRSFLGQAEEWASEGGGAGAAGANTERIVDLNSVYELDPWNGSHLLAHRA